MGKRGWVEYLRMLGLPRRTFDQPEPEWLKHLDGPITCSNKHEMITRAKERSLLRDALPALDPDDPGAECDPPFED